MKRKLFLASAFFALSAMIVLALVPTRSLRAQGRSNDPGNRPAVQDDGTVVAPDGAVFASQKEFAEHGRRCASKHHDEITVEEINREAKAHGNGRKPGGGGGDGDGGDVTLAAASCSITINV